MAASLLAKMRQKGAGHPQEAEDVSLEHRHELSLGDLFDRTRNAITCVVHQNIHPSELGNRLVDRGVNLGLIGYIERQHETTVRALITKICDLLRFTCRSNNFMPGSQRLLGKHPAKTSRCSRNKPNALRRLSHKSYSAPVIGQTLTVCDVYVELAMSI